MEKTENTIFEPVQVPNKNWIKEPDRRQMDSSFFNSFKVPRDDKRIITLCRPFVVLSKNSYSTPITLPLGLAYLGAVLEKAGYKCKIIDATGESYPVKIRRSQDNKYNIQGLTAEEIIEKIDSNTFILGITLMFSLEWFSHRFFIEKIKKKFPNIIIVVGGEHPSAIPEYVLRDCPSIDYIIRGEGEISMLEFSYSIFSGRDVSKIPGLCFVDKDNKFRDNGLSKRIEHIDTLPRPAWHLLKPKNYFNDFFTFGITSGRTMPILATRGCPYQCTFCSSPSMWTTRYIMREPKEIVNEIEWLKKEYDANNFEFFDLTAIIKRSWILDFCKELTDRKIIDITWQLPVGTRSESLDEETLHMQLDITTSESYCENVSGKMLRFLRFLVFSLSYIAIYISRPKRIVMLIKNIFRKKFLANNLFEQRVYDIYRRFKLNTAAFESSNPKKDESHPAEKH